MPEIWGRENLDSAAANHQGPGRRSLLSFSSPNVRRHVLCRLVLRPFRKCRHLVFPEQRWDSVVGSSADHQRHILGLGALVDAGIRQDRLVGLGLCPLGQQRCLGIDFNGPADVVFTAPARNKHERQRRLPLSQPIAKRRPSANLDQVRLPERAGMELFVLRWIYGDLSGEVQRWNEVDLAGTVDKKRPGRRAFTPVPSRCKGVEPGRLDLGCNGSVWRHRGHALRRSTAICYFSIHVSQDARLLSQSDSRFGREVLAYLGIEEIGNTQHLVCNLQGACSAIVLAR